MKIIKTFILLVIFILLTNISLYSQSELLDEEYRHKTKEPTDNHINEK